MPIRDLVKHIIVHVDASTAGQDRLRFAASLAQRFAAYLTGIGEPEDPVLEQTFADAIEARALGGEWIGATGSIEEFVAHRAHAADLVIVGQYEPGFPNSLEKPEEVILNSGRPVLVMPSSKPVAHVGENVIVAWNDSREAALAVEGALPLMMDASPVTIVSVNPEAEADWEVGGDLVRQFARHGLRARAETIADNGRPPAGLVCARAASDRTDLIVMGAYGHSRVREMVLGGMTRDMLAEMPVPLLMAH